MKLIIGGAFQGKKAYAEKTFGIPKEEFSDGAVCRPEELFSAKAVCHFHEYIRRCLREGKQVTDLAEELAEKNPEILVIANELGSGVVPADAFDREYREVAGRVLCALAKEAAQVHRVVCGIGTVIKDG